MEDFRIQFMEYGPHKGEYISIIKFENDEQESFVIKIPSEISQEILNLVSGAINTSADQIIKHLKEIK